MIFVCICAFLLLPCSCLKVGGGRWLVAVGPAVSCGYIIVSDKSYASVDLELPHTLTVCHHGSGSSACDR